MWLRTNRPKKFLTNKGESLPETNGKDVAYPTGKSTSAPWSVMWYRPNLASLTFPCNERERWKYRHHSFDCLAVWSNYLFLWFVCIYLAVHEDIVRAEGSVNHAVFVHELETFKDLVGYLPHRLWANKKKQQKQHIMALCFLQLSSDRCQR